LSQERVQGEKIRCVGRRISRTRLIHYTGRHRAMEVYVDGNPAVAEVVREWRVVRKAPSLLTPLSRSLTSGKGYDTHNLKTIRGNV